jgi:hypothetical protein
MKGIIIMGCIGLLVLTGCSKDDEVKPLPEVGSNLIDLNAMQVEQTNQYVLLLGEEYYKQDAYHAYDYVPDTLVVEIIEKNGDQFKWREYLTDYSASKDSSVNVWGGDRIIEYWTYIAGDTLWIDASEGEHYSTFLFHHISFKTWTSSDYIMPVPLSEFTGIEADVVGWKTTLPYGESFREAFDPEFSLFDVDYEKVNILIDNIPMQVDGNGKTYVYNKAHGMIRTSTYSWWTSTGYGWDLLPGGL